jgi:lysophospholipase L1-like esterase
MYGWNDHWAAANGIPDEEQRFPPDIIIALQNGLSRLHSYRLLKKLLLSPIEKHPDSLYDRGQVIYRVGLNDFDANLTAICRAAKERGVVPILMTSPIPQLETYYPLEARSPMHAFHERYNTVVRSVAILEQVPLIDLAAEFDKYGDLWDDALSDPIHFNTKGHRLAADLIGQYMAELMAANPVNKAEDGK